MIRSKEIASPIQDPVEQSEEVLVGRAQRGDEEAFETLYLRHTRYVGRVLYRVLGGDDPETQDLLQLSFMEAAQRLTTLRDPTAFRPWVTQIAVRMAISRIRKRQRWRVVSGWLASFSRSSGDRRTAEPVIELWDLLRRVHVDDRVPWVLKNVEGETVLRIAELTGTSPSTVKRRIKRCDQYMDEVLGD